MYRRGLEGIPYFLIQPPMFPRKVVDHRAETNDGMHTPENLVSLCDFHHALEPEKGHERIWGNIKTRYFTLVCDHERSNRVSDGTHAVRAHLRRLQLVSLDELRELTKTYGFSCPSLSWSEGALSTQ